MDLFVNIPQQRGYQALVNNIQNYNHYLVSNHNRGIPESCVLFRNEFIRKCNEYMGGIQHIFRIELIIRILSELSQHNNIYVQIISVLVLEDIQVLLRDHIITEESLFRIQLIPNPYDGENELFIALADNELQLLWSTRLISYGELESINAIVARYNLLPEETLHNFISRHMNIFDDLIAAYRRGEPLDRILDDNMDVDM